MAVIVLHIICLMWWQLSFAPGYIHFGAGGNSAPDYVLVGVILLQITCGVGVILLQIMF